VSEDKVLVDLPLTSFEFVKALERQFLVFFSDWRKRCGKKVNKQRQRSKHGNEEQIVFREKIQRHT
jgi:hypothetical protein